MDDHVAVVFAQPDLVAHHRGQGAIGKIDFSAVGDPRADQQRAVRVNLAEVGDFADDILDVEIPRSEVRNRDIARDRDQATHVDIGTVCKVHSRLVGEHA